MASRTRCVVRSKSHVVGAGGLGDRMPVATRYLLLTVSYRMFTSYLRDEVRLDWMPVAT